ncbi:MAG: hypothetical protein ACRC1M_01990 [Methanobacteriaceae archaeon]
MNLVLIENNKISSLEILKQINIFRLQEGKKTELAHNDLLKIIRDEFEEEISLGKISQSKYKNSRGKEYPLFELTTSEAKQVLVRESKFVRKAIIKVLDEYEKKEQEKNLKDNLLLNIIKSDSETNRAIALNRYELEYVKPLELENKNLNTEVMHKEDVIVTLVKDVTLAEKRQRITQIVRYNSNEYKERYNLLYSEFEKKYHMNLKRRINSDEYKHIKPRIKSKMELIDRGLNMIPELFELTCVLFETDYKEILKKFEQGEL